MIAVQIIPVRFLMLHCRTEETIGIFSSVVIFIPTDITGMKIKLSGDKTTYLDANAALSYYVADNCFFFVGYRHSDIDGDQDNTAFEYTLSGPMAGVVFRF